MYTYIQTDQPSSIGSSDLLIRLLYSYSPLPPPTPPPFFFSLSLLIFEDDGYICTRVDVNSQRVITEELSFSITSVDFNLDASREWSSPAEMNRSWLVLSSLSLSPSLTSLRLFPNPQPLLELFPPSFSSPPHRLFIQNILLVLLSSLDKFRRWGIPRRPKHTVSSSLPVSILSVHPQFSPSPASSSVSLPGLPTSTSPPTQRLQSRAWLSSERLHRHARLYLALWSSSKQGVHLSIAIQKSSPHGRTDIRFCHLSLLFRRTVLLFRISRESSLATVQPQSLTRS